MSGLDDICQDCVSQRGLCGRDHCRRQVLPLLKGPTGLLRLIGEALVEQRDRQTRDPAPSAPVSPEQLEHRRRKQHARSQKLAKSRKHARAIARSQRRGLFGLHLKIAAGAFPL